MKRNPKVLKVVSTEKCPKCFILMERRSHAFMTEKMKKQPYYFSEWDVCTKCHHVQMYERYKVHTNNHFSQVLQREEEMDSLFKNL